MKPIDRKVLLFADRLSAIRERERRGGCDSMNIVERMGLFYLKRTFWPWTNLVCARVLCEDGRYRNDYNVVWPEGW